MRRALPVIALLSGAALTACTDNPTTPGPPTSVPVITTSAGPTGSQAIPRPSDSSPGPAAVLTSNLAVAWGVAFLPDGSALVTERDSHRIVRVDRRGSVSPVGVVPGVADNTGEGGLLGIALSPSFADDGLVYAYLTSDTDNRVVRMPYRNGQLGPASVVFSGIPKAAIHNGGRIAFGPDDRLYVTTGDATQRDRAPDRDYLGGKVLRMTADGAPAPGNPFAGSVVYTVGHRNPQGLAWGPDGSLYEAEFGQNTLDEINRLQPGHDYGWPTVEGTVGASNPDLTPPLLTWDTDEASPSGLAFAGDSLWLAALQGERIYRIPVLEPGRVGRPSALLDGRFGRLRTIARAPDGSLWVTTSNRDGRGDPVDGDDRIIRIPLG
ncbi:MAG TPA: PQQ-dependent sugar dehydrogenase [Jatrophihabitantaceae bacterium]|jgi:glucose/arabinose dehydrogenase